MRKLSSADFGIISLIVGSFAGVGLVASGFLHLGPKAEPVAAAIIADLRENPETWRSDGMLNWTNGRWTVASEGEGATWPRPLIVCAGDQTLGNRPVPALAPEDDTIVSSEMVQQYWRDNMDRACSNEPSARLSRESNDALQEAFSDHVKGAAENMRRADMRAVEKATGV